MGAGGGVVAVCEYMGGTRGSVVVSSTVDVLEMSMERWLEAYAECGKSVCAWLRAGWELFRECG